jgi:type IX secretion system PorP/SprF family membrane protein
LKHIAFILTLLLAITSVKEVAAQDIHFSQFYNSPCNINPGFVGQFNGAYRFIANQRTQWRSITLPYSTFGFSAEARHLTLPDGVFNKKDSNKLATTWNTALSFYNDKAGDSRLKSNIIQLAVGKEISTGDNSHISPSVMLSFTGLSIDYSQLNYDNQWNGLAYDPNINPSENFARNQRSYLTTSIGAVFTNRWSNVKNFTAGIGVFNLTKPKQSFFDSPNVQLDSRVNLHAQYLFPINTTWLGEPIFLWSLQGAYRELNMGARAFYILEEKKWTSTRLYAGAVGRARDAGYVIAGIKHNEWEAGVSYDINTSNLKPASSGKGGFEFSFIYIVPSPPKSFPVKVCKDWM